MNNHSANSYEATERRKMQKVKLGEICEITMGQSPESQYYNVLAQGLPFFQGNADFGDRHPVVRVWCTNPKKTSDVGAILMSVRAPIGALNLVNVKCAIGRGLVSIKPNSRCMLKYLWYALKSKVDVLKSMGTGSTFKAISKPIVEELEIPLPPIEEQRAIAERLDKVSQLVDKRKEQLQQLDQLVKSQFIDMFGDLITNSKAWDFLPLGKICDVRDGTHESPKYCKEGYPLLTSKNFTDGKVNFFGANFISEKDFISINSRSKVDYGDIVMPMIGTIGHPVIVSTRKPFAIKNVALIKFSGSNFLNVFIKAILESDYFLSLIKSKNRGNTQKFISLGDIREISIPIVSKSEQIKFAGFVERVEKIKEKVNNSLTQLNLLKQSLMQQYFG